MDEEFEDDDYIPMSQVAKRPSSGRVQHNFGAPDDEDDDEAGEKPEQDDGAEAHQQQQEQPDTNLHRHSCMRGANMTQSKCFNDPVHGHMRLDGRFVQFIDTRPFQRLRSLQQLGLTSYVFSGATHTRFEHSLGVCFKAFEFADVIYSVQGKALGMRVRDLLTVGLAGLCHDLGHGPFSHVWDHEFLAAKGIDTWKHEDMSCQMFDHIIDTYHIDSISKGEADMVKHLIKGEWEGKPGKAFLFDIVANQRNSLDVDKADYLARDALHCGVKVSSDFNRLMGLSKVIGDQICYKWSEFINVMEVFHARSIMHRRVYTHRKAKAIELMVVDALLEADTALGFSSHIWDPARFLRLDDTLLRKVEDYEECYQHVVDAGLGQPLRAAADIITRLRNREIYRFVNECTVPTMSKEKAEQWRPPTAEELCGYWHSNGQVRLDPSQVCVNVNRINWAMKDRNPLDSVRWFKDFRDTCWLAKNARHMTSMITPVFQELTLRVYSKVRDPQVEAALSCALEAYCKKAFGMQAELATPCKAGPATGGPSGQNLNGQPAAGPGHQALGSITEEGGAGHAGGQQEGDADEGDTQGRRRGAKRSRKSLAGEFDEAV